MTVIAILLLAFFLTTALLHFYWAMGGGSGLGATVPHVEGEPLFTPSKLSTIAVGIVLLGMGAMVLWRIDAIALPFPRVWSTVGTSLIATAFTLRAVGEFKYVGFFKRVRDTKFARMDTQLYSPLCLGVAIGLWLLVLA